MVVTTASANACSGNPLRSLPSVLAIRPAQDCVHRLLEQADADENVLVDLLQLDPLAVVRGLRAAHAPVFRTSPSLPSVRRMVQCLGVSNCRRLLLNPPVELAASSPIRVLWPHAVATAIAAQDFATSTGLIDPEAAYLLGLLHDLPAWLVALRPTAPGMVGASPSDWIAHWQLPTALVAHLHATRSIGPDLAMLTVTDVAGLVRVAERLAALAGYPHPSRGPNSADSQAALTATADKADLQVAQRLRQHLEATFTAFAISPMAVHRGESHSPAATALPGRRHGNLDEAVLGIVGCARSDSYRGIVTALTGAALRYGGYDRAFYAKWQPHTGIVTLRSKADAAARRIATLRYQATAAENEALRTALGSDRPVRVESMLRRGQGLLAGLSTDELLAVPLNGDFVQPAFLLLDRSLTLEPIDMGRDLTMAVTLGKVGSLLNENLLLRRRRQRAQKFALTDPLTRLFNRRMGLLALEQEVARTERTDLPLTVLMCDLDHFKQLNDNLGHLQGDFALRATAEVLRLTLRKGDTVCRYGGEEFLIVLPDTTPDEAAVLAARLFTNVHNRGEELGLPITISIGLTAFRQGDTIETLLMRADHALYASKGYGRNRFSADIDAPDDGSTVPSDTP